MLETCHRVYEEAGTVLTMDEFDYPTGFASHDVGCVRMGADPKTSVLNGSNQAHEIKNLFVVDGGCFPTFPEKNPTLTIVALAIRAAESIMRFSRQGEV